MPIIALQTPLSKMLGRNGCAILWQDSTVSHKHEHTCGYRSIPSLPPFVQSVFIAIVLPLFLGYNLVSSSVSQAADLYKERNRMYKLIAIDIDDTLINDDKEVT
ncbi:hypothetical protein, partial [Paenibacillus durus]|uniref:hypothetical protein n=1 Tax=Paenibacillus durus TaxID=44251 RepID=UPI001B808C34